MVYHGKRVDLIPYFTELGYPCPEFRNPLDHYSQYSRDLLRLLYSLDHYSQYSRDILRLLTVSILEIYSNWISCVNLFTMYNEWEKRPTDFILGIILHLRTVIQVNIISFCLGKRDTSGSGL